MIRTNFSDPPTELDWVGLKTDIAYDTAYYALSNASDAWVLAEEVREENKALRQRIAELEKCVDGLAAIVFGLGD